MIAHEDAPLAHAPNPFFATHFDERRFEQREHWRMRILEAITSGVPLSPILDLLVRSVEKDDPAVICSILLLDAEGKHLLTGSAPSLPESYNRAIDGLEIGPGVGSCGTCAFTGKRVIAPDVLTHPDWEKFRSLAQKAGLRSAWSEPIISTKGQVLGTFAIYHRFVCAPDEEQINTIAYCAKLASIVIERKQAEESLLKAKQAAETASKIKSQFIALMSHELRTPLSPVKMILHEWKTNPAFPEAFTGDLEVLEQQIDAEIKLISDLLAMAELDYSKIKFSKQHFDVEELLRVTALLLAGAYDQKGVHLCTAFEAQQTQVFSDSLRLQQVFRNLLANALKFTEPGGSVIVCTHDDGDQIRIDFTDTGMGIKHEDLERIFEPFEQGDRADSPATFGVGLGLPIAKGLLQALGGVLLVRSLGPGRGSTFTILLDTEASQPLS